MEWCVCVYIYIYIYVYIYTHTNISSRLDGVERASKQHRHVIKGTKAGTIHTHTHTHTLSFNIIKAGTIQSGGCLCVYIHIHTHKQKT